jgi:hypothetical protein
MAKTMFPNLRYRSWQDLMIVAVVPQVSMLPNIAAKYNQKQKQNKKKHLSTYNEPANPMNKLMTNEQSKEQEIL